MDKRPTIIFSHAYKKLMLNGKPTQTATLLLVLNVPMGAIQDSKDFLEYDTDNKFVLPYDTWYLVLIFKKSNGDLFTTVRPASRNKMAFGFNAKYKSKEEYYKGLIGQEFQIQITAS
jgi:hypothetical protein